MTRTIIVEDQKFDSIDFTKREAIIELFPLYKRVQLASRKALPKSVNIPSFTMQTPYKDKILLQSTELILEPNRRQVLFGPNSCGKTLLFKYMLDGKLRDFQPICTFTTAKSLRNLSSTTLPLIPLSNPTPF